MGKKSKSKLTYILFGIYCILLVWIIIFKLSVSITQVEMLLGPRSINFIPFYYKNETGFHYKEVIMNVIIFIPLGLYLKMLDINSKKAAIFGLSFSFVLEFCQFIFSIGASDITDILTNTFGTAMGVALYLLFVKVLQNREKANKIISCLALIATIAFVVLLLLLIAAN